MPDIFYLISRWWKQMLVVIFISLLTAGIIVYTKPLKYLSVATAVPGSVVSSDKSRIFSENIQALYSDLGLPEDLDMIVGTGQLDTIYLAVTDQFNLYDHYKVLEQGNEARIKAAYLLQKNSKVMKSEYGELKVKVWDTDKDLAPQLANALMEKLKTIHQDLQNANNHTSLEGLKIAKGKIKLQIDTLDTKTKMNEKNNEENISNRKILSDRLQQYEKLISEYQLMLDSKPPALVVVEKARTSPWPDKPKRIETMIVTFLLSFLFALLLALVMERRKTVSL